MGGVGCNDINSIDEFRVFLGEDALVCVVCK